MSSTGHISVQFPLPKESSMRRPLIIGDICPECGNHLRANSKVCTKCDYNAMPEYEKTLNLTT